ncbi:MAG: hypothetical protein Q8K00_19080 [Syntrophales bacterium]|nr:hypothetical protein [Syntrophales bacterium]
MKRKPSDSFPFGPYGEESVEDKRFESTALLSASGTPNAELLAAFLDSTNWHQRQVFKRLKSRRESVAIDVFTSAATSLITSECEDWERRKEALKSLVSFVTYGDEGLMHYTTEARDALGESYDRLLLALSLCFRRGTAPVEQLREILIALAEMDYFRAKRTMMLSIISYEFPKDPNWFIERLAVVGRGLSCGDEEIARYALAFLVFSRETLEELLEDARVEVAKRAILRGDLATIDAIVPKYLLAEDVRVVVLSSYYCGGRKLHDTREIIDQLARCDNEKIRGAAGEALRLLGS